MIVQPLELASRHGLKATSFEVLVQRADHLVARVETSHGAVVLKANTEPGALASEVTNAELLAAAGFPTPEVLERSEEPVSYIISRWIDGEGLSASSPVQAQLEAGGLLKRVHDLGAHVPNDLKQPWEEWMKGWLNHALRWWVESGDAQPARIELVWTGFEEIRPLLATRGHHFTLFDGRPEHFIVRDGRIVGLIDLHAARSGDGGMDLGVMGVLDEALLINVRRGYGTDAADAETLDRLIPFYVFLRRLARAEWHRTFGSESGALRILRLAAENPYGPTV